MKIKHITLAACLAAALPAMAAVSADEAKQLGSTLTEFGAIKAGNADGTIPAYTGGLRKAPAGFKPDSGFWVDPFKDEKPLFTITGKNMDKYADKLSDGQKHMLKKFPTYVINVYPSHRTAAYPDQVLKQTVKNATACKTANEGLSVVRECRGGMPFPIPKTGYEVMWNQILRYQGDESLTTPASRSWVVDSSGRPTMTAEQATASEFPYYQTLADRDQDMVWRVYSYTKSPARKAGEMTGIMDYIDPTTKPRKAWSYTPGMRRVKLSPEFSYDTPVASMGGVTLFDELFVFSGKMDRFDFKLVGKKEMYLPYNGYKNNFDCPAEVSMLAQHANPDCERFELHRVWKVEATLKPGMRHVYSKRVFYFDEDLTGAAMFDTFDQSGNLYRTLLTTHAQMYDKLTPMANKNVIYDFNKGMYAYVNDVSVGGYKFKPNPTEREQNPEALVSKTTAR